MGSKLTTTSPNALFIPADTDKNTASSLRRYVSWLDTTERNWFQADLKEYRDYLKNRTDLSDSTAKKHLERVRKRYRDLLNSNDLRDNLQAMYLELPAETRQKWSPFEFTQEAIIRLSNNTQYENAPLKATEIRDHADGDKRWLTTDEIDILLELPFQLYKRRRLIALRDRAAFALAYCCGLREAELCAVTLDDMNQTYGGSPALKVRNGKGMVQRMVVYGGMAQYLTFVDEWIEAAGITEGCIVIGFTPYGIKPMLENCLSPRQFQQRCKLYWKHIGKFTPHDLRRSYARRLHQNGMAVEAIAQQMGHKRTITTLDYIGALSAGERAPVIED